VVADAEPFINPAESPAAVARLLQLLEGVAVEHVWLNERRVTIRVRVSSIDSLSRIDQHVFVSNMRRLTVRSVGPPVAYGAAANPLEAEFEATHDRGADGVPTQLEVFGIFLARDLKVLGRLAAEESDRLQREWNAVVM